MAASEFVWKREYSLFYGAACLFSLQDWAQRELDKKSGITAMGKEGWITLYLQQDIRTKLRQKLRNVILHDPIKFRRYVDDVHTHGREFVAVARKMKTSSKSSDEKLLADLEIYFRALRSFSIDLWISFHLADMAEKIFVERISKLVVPEKINEAMEWYAVPSKKVGVLKVREELLMIPRRVG